MIIDLETLALPPQLVHEAVTTAAVVRHLNRNRTGNPTVLIITDSVLTVKKHIILDKRDYEYADTCLGLTWHRPIGAHIWLSPMWRSGGNAPERPYDLANLGDRRQVVRTLVHELAHAMVGPKHAHGWTFRRMFTLLIELIGNRHFGEWIGQHYDPEQEAWSVILRYQRHGDYYRPTADALAEAWSDARQRRREEVSKHVFALDRAAKRYDKIHVLG